MVLAGFEVGLRRTVLSVVVEVVLVDLLVGRLGSWAGDGRRCFVAAIALRAECRGAPWRREMEGRRVVLSVVADAHRCLRGVVVYWRIYGAVIIEGLQREECWRERDDRCAET